MTGLRGIGALLAATVALGPLSAAAQATDWEFTVTPYVWVPGTTTTIQTDRGSVTADSNGSSVLSDLDFAFMGTFEARRGKWGIIGDLLYADLSANKDTPLGFLFDDATVETRVTALSGYVAYRVYEDTQLAADVLGGFRAYSAELDLSLGAGRLKSESTSLSEDWVDPLIGGRVGFRFAEKWSATAAADVGGFDGADDFTWQALATVGYHFDERWAVRAGWRYLKIEKAIDGFDTSVELNGPVVGVQYDF